MSMTYMESVGVLTVQKLRKIMFLLNNTKVNWKVNKKKQMEFYTRSTKKPMLLLVTTLHGLLLISLLTEDQKNKCSEFCPLAHLETLLLPISMIQKLSQNYIFLNKQTNGIFATQSLIFCTTKTLQDHNGYMKLLEINTECSFTQETLMVQLLLSEQLNGLMK